MSTRYRACGESCGERSHIWPAPARPTQAEPFWSDQVCPGPAAVGSREVPQHLLEDGVVRHLQGPVWPVTVGELVNLWPMVGEDEPLLQELFDDLSDFEQAFWPRGAADAVSTYHSLPEGNGSESKLLVALWAKRRPGWSLRLHRRLPEPAELDARAACRRRSPSPCRDWYRGVALVGGGKRSARRSNTPRFHRPLPHPRYCSTPWELGKLGSNLLSKGVISAGWYSILTGLDTTNPATRNTR